MSPAHPESANTASSPRDAPFPDLRSRFDKILNGDPAASPLGGAHRRGAPYSSHRAPQRVRLRFSLPCGLVGCLFEQPVRPQSHLYPSFFLNNSFTFPGFAFPPLAFITCPTRNPSTCCLPSLNCATCAGLFSNTSSMIFASSPSSETCIRPLSSTISLASLRVSNIT